MDLFLWVDDSGEITAFQLSYDKPARERTLSWDRERGFEHLRVDEGARPGKHPGSPLLVPDGQVPFDRLMATFIERSAEMDAGIRDFVTGKLREHAREAHERGPATGPRTPGLVRRLIGLLRNWWR